MSIDILPTVDELAILSAVEDALAAELPIARLRGGAIPASLDAAQWGTFAALGWTTLSLAEDAGGAGASLAEEALVHRAFGRHLVTTSLLATAFTAQLLAHTDAGSAIGDGTAHAAFALGAGTDALVIDGVDASHLLLVDDGTVTLLDAAAVPSGTPVNPLDATLPMQRVARGDLRAGRPVPDEQRDRLSILLAAQLGGAASASTDLAVAYAKVREQFGKPIGSFQAVAHSCADMAMRAEAAYAQLLFAAISVRDGQPDSRFQAACARRIAADAAFRNGTASIQVHGGMGYSAECDAHLYLKRALVLGRLADAVEGARW